MREVGNEVFLIRRERDVELNGLGAGFYEGRELVASDRGARAIEVLDDADFGGLRLVVADPGMGCVFACDTR